MFIKPDEAAKLLDVAPNTLAKMRIAGNGPSFVKVGRNVRYRPADIEAWVNARTVRSTSQAVG